MITATAKRSIVVLRERGTFKSSVVRFSSKFAAQHAARLFVERGYHLASDVLIAATCLECIRDEGR